MRHIETPSRVADITFMVSSSGVVPVVVKFWLEDGVWNAVAEDLSVAVYADTLEAARDMLRVALIEHFQLAHEMGFFQELVSHLVSTRAHSVEDAEPDALLGMMPIPAVSTDCHVC